MVELLPLNEENDLKYVRELLIEFKKKTGSIIAEELLQNWPASTNKFVKVRTVFNLKFTYIKSNRHATYLIFKYYVGISLRISKGAETNGDRNPTVTENKLWRSECVAVQNVIYERHRRNDCGFGFPKEKT